MTSGCGFPGQRTSKKLMLRVRPGVELVRANLVSISVLITLDLPTFDRPRKATSGKLGAGNCAASVAAAMNRAMTLMSQCAMPQRKLASRADGFGCGGSFNSSSMLVALALRSKANAAWAKAENRELATEN